MMPHFVYIIYSPGTKRFYVGETINMEERVKQHNSGFYKSSSTKFACDWEIFVSIECQSREQALHIEKYIKKMKSRGYYYRLKSESGLVVQLLNKFCG